MPNPLRSAERRLRRARRRSWPWLSPRAYAHIYRQIASLEERVRALRYAACEAAIRQSYVEIRSEHGAASAKASRRLQRAQLRLYGPDIFR